MGGNNDGLSSLNTYFSQTFEEVRFFKRLILSITNYSIVIQGALVYTYNLIITYCKYTFSESHYIFMIASIICCAISIYWIADTWEALVKVRKSQTQIVDQLDESTNSVYYYNEEGLGREELKKKITSKGYDNIFFLIIFLIIISGCIISFHLMNVMKNAELLVH